MRKIICDCFPSAERVIDRFHLQQLAFYGIQEICIAHRWDAINKEANEQENAKLLGIKYRPKVLSNGDTLKQLLAKNRYLLFKSPEKWNKSQEERAGLLLFQRYPDFKAEYSLTHSLRMIYNKTQSKKQSVFHCPDGRTK